MGKDVANLHKRSRVYGLHFKTRMFLNNLRKGLKYGAVPTLFWSLERISSDHTYCTFVPNEEVIETMDVKQEPFDTNVEIIKKEPDLVSNQIDGNNLYSTKDKTFENDQDCLLGDTNNICEYQTTREFVNADGIKQECELLEIEESVCNNVNNFADTINKEPQNANEGEHIKPVVSEMSEYIQFKDESELLTSYCDLPDLKSEIDVTDNPNYFSPPCSSKQTIIKSKLSKHTLRNVPKQKKSGFVLQKIFQNDILGPNLVYE